MNIQRTLVLMLALFLIILTIVYFYLATTITDDVQKSILLPFILEIFGSLVFGLFVSVSGIFLEKILNENSYKRTLVRELNILKSLIRNLFKRRQSKWNFNNRTPSFYFDNSWVYPLYELLKSENNRWAILVNEYTDIFVDKTKETKLILALHNFIETVEVALTNAEALDQDILGNLVEKSTDTKDSPYSIDIAAAHEDMMFNFLVLRAKLINIDEKDIRTGIAYLSQIRPSKTKIQNILNNYLAFLDKKNDIEEQSKKLTKIRLSLVKKSEKIKNLVIK